MFNRLFEDSDKVNAVDPNLVGGDRDDAERLVSEDEGSDVFNNESDEDYSSESEDENEAMDDLVGVETARIAAALDAEEQRALHLRVEGSSVVYNEDQLRHMALYGWEVFPENHAAHVETEEEEENKMYDGYCGPSDDVMCHAHLIIDLFFYFLPKRFWMTIANETNRY